MTTSSSPSPLPTPSALLTSLFDSISSIPISHAPDPLPTTARKPPNPSNPLSQIPPSHRPLLTTLHAIYPSTLLPALDILDRGLVSRVYVQHPSSSSTSPLPSTAPANPPTAPTFHLVRSASSDSSGPRRARKPDSVVEGGGSGYIVRLASWSCSCASFAFSAFPGASSCARSSYAIHPPTQHPGRAAGRDAAEIQAQGEEKGKGGRYEFGGIPGLARHAPRCPTAPTTTIDNSTHTINDSTDDTHALPPCCKHILACLLAERWRASGERQGEGGRGEDEEGDLVLGGYVSERVVSAEEGAGLVADI
ncbi:hypothetical protein F4810DRAFT_160636 [Camillea tinctor]|nr:hypothetical protein F4810DRAFT_160636 [Camillea tinctor]